MRIQLNIDEPHLRELDRMAAQERRSRAAMIRQAIEEYLNRRTPQIVDEAFGLWGERKIDGLTYQHKVRSEEWL